MSLESVSKTRLMPVAVIPTLESALPLAEALLEAGLPHIEITLRTPCALDAMAAIRKAYPEMTVGAGTIIDAGVLPKLVDMGVAFGVSPGLNPVVIEKAQSLDFLMIPGVITPGEVERGLSMGLNLLKFFPAEQAGGAAYLKSLSSPFGGVKFCPTGGVSAENASDYLSLPNVLCVGGSWVAPKSAVAAGDWDRVTALAKEAAGAK